MHVHSSASTTSARWILRALKAPESFTPPDLVYEQARSRGMDFVTITDMNTIDGVMKISGLPGVFMSEEVAMIMPESKSMVHILVYGIDHAQHDRIATLRERGFELFEYLRDQQLAHSLAHPFYSPGGHLPPGEWSDLMRAVELVEVRNGTRASWENSAALETAGTIKGQGFVGYTAGSDDHCGRFIGLTWTMVQKANTIQDFLQAVREGEGIPGGEHGTAIRSAYAVYSIAYSFYRDSLHAKKVPSVAFMAADNFFNPSRTHDGEEPTLWHKADFLFHQLLKKARKSISKPSLPTNFSR
jgi:predicted metal-dependent phosphoesterase TrpH